MQIAMNNSYIFLPMLAQILLVIALYIQLARVKVAESVKGNVDENRRALYDDAWPESVIKINNCIRNQFELPLLFYLLIVVLWLLNAVNLFVHILAWLFVFTRFIHAYIHTGSNNIFQRRKIFTYGCLIVLALTLFTIFIVITNH